jgi:hypothetical protein
MTTEIPKAKWTEFFNELSKRRFGWKTKVEVLGETLGASILSEGLPFDGITFEEMPGRKEIELSVGKTFDQHQTHKISNPVKVEYLDNGDFFGGVIEIEEENETRTLVRLLNPLPIDLSLIV